MPSLLVKMHIPKKKKKNAHTYLAVFINLKASS